MFDIHQRISDEHGENDEERRYEYMDGLGEEFARSPEAEAFLKEYQSGLGYFSMFLDYYFGYIGGTVPEMNVRDAEEVIFELFPRKVSTEPENAPEIIAELRAFWTFLSRQYALPQAGKVLALLDDDGVVRLRTELDNPANYGMAKGFVMMGQKAGFDMTTQEGNEQFMLAYNASLALRRIPPEPSSSPPIFPGFSMGPQGTKADRKRKKAQRQARKKNRR